MKERTQKERIEYYEKLMDEIKASIDNMDKTLDRFEKIKPKIKKLKKYYESPEWKKDFEDDEKGLLPKDLKRGVLSEDGIYNTLDEYNEIAERIRKTVKKC